MRDDLGRWSHRQYERESRRLWWLEAWELGLYGMQARDVPDRRRTHLSFRAWNRVVRPSLNDREWLHLTENKLVFGRYYEACGVPVPRTLGFVSRDAGHDRAGRPAPDFSTLIDRLPGVETSGLVIKPVAGGTGHGVLVIDRVRPSAGGQPAVAITSDGKERTVEGLEVVAEESFRGATGCVVQARESIHPWFAELSGGAPASSIRVVTFRPDGSDPVIQMAVCRLGRRGQMLENWARGGVAVGIQPQSGELMRGHLKADGGCWVDEHPDSQIPLYGRVLPMWQEVRQLALEAARVTPGLRSIGWDVFPTPDGPVIVEGNANWGLQSMQLHHGGVIGTPVGDAWAAHGADLPDGERWHRRHDRRGLNWKGRAADRLRSIIAR